MIEQSKNPEPVDNGRDKQLNAVAIQLRSQRASEVLYGMNRVRRWLKDNPEDSEVYKLLLNAVQENQKLRDQARNLLVEMKGQGSRAAKEAFSTLPSSVQDLLADADDHYYAGEYEEAISLYRRVLELNPDNLRAKDHLAKAELKRIAGETETGMPRAAEQYYRRARSYIAARDVSTAINLLSAAIETARAKGMEYPDADQALNNMHDLLTADQFKREAGYSLEMEQWEVALDLYQKALTLDPTNVVIKKEFESLEGLLYTQTELRKKGIKKFFTSIGEWRNALRTARGVLNPDNAMLNFVEKQINQIRLIRNGSMFAILVVIGIVIYSILPVTIEVAPPITTETMLSAISNTPKGTPTPTPTFTSAATSTILPTMTTAPTLGPTPTVVLGYGRLTTNFFPVEEPNGKRIESGLFRKQYVTVVDSRFDSGERWYKCTWEVEDALVEGWIIGGSIEFVPPPIPTISPTN